MKRAAARPNEALKEQRGEGEGAQKEQRGEGEGAPGGIKPLSM